MIKPKTFITEGEKMYYIDEYWNKWDVTDFQDELRERGLL